MPSTDKPSTPGLCANLHGFSLHAAVRWGADQRKQLEHLCRYITRPAIANERLKCNRAGQVMLQLKSSQKDSTTHIVMSPLEFMQRLAALVPRPRLHLIRFHGVLAPNVKLRCEIIPSPAEHATDHQPPRADAGPEDSPAVARFSPNTRVIDYSPVRRYSSRQRKRVFRFPIRRLRMEAVLNDGSTTIYCIDAEDDFCSGLQNNGLAVIRGSLGYRYAQAMVRNIAHPPHECDVIVYNLRDPACYDASSWGPGLNDNYHCEVVKLERDDRQRLFHYKDKERKYSQYRVVSETQISRAWIGGSGSFDGTDVLKAVSQGGLPLVYFLNPTFLAHVSHYLPLWLQMTIDISPTVANEYDLLDLAHRFSQSLSSIGRGNLEFARPINFRVDKVTSSNNASKIMLSKLALNRVGDVLAALVSCGKGHIFFMPPFQNEINGCVDLIKNIIPRFQEDLQRSAEKNRAEMEATIAGTPLDSTTPDMIALQAVRNTREYIEKVVHEVNTCYRNGCFNASGAMIRRLVETLIIEIYETNERAQEIQDNDGNFLKLERLIGKVSSGSFVNISRSTKQFLKDPKVLGDTAVHNRKVLLIKDDLDSEKVSLRVAISELVKHARF